MATEKLKFKLELYATMWDLPPVAEILINDKVSLQRKSRHLKSNPDIIEFEHEFTEDSDYSLIIKRSAKLKIRLF
jgi:hypothetical protein